MAAMRVSPMVIRQLHIRCNCDEELSFRVFHPQIMIMVGLVILLIGVFMLKIMARFLCQWMRVAIELLRGIVLTLRSGYWLQPCEVPVCVAPGCSSHRSVRKRREQGEILRAYPISA